jgi:hypothetical protein
MRVVDLIPVHLARSITVQAALGEVLDHGRVPQRMVGLQRQ